MGGASSFSLQRKKEPDSRFLNSMRKRTNSLWQLQNSKRNIYTTEQDFLTVLEKEPSEFYDMLKDRSAPEQHALVTTIVEQYKRLSLLDTLTLKMQKIEPSLKPRLKEAVRCVCEVIDCDRALVYIVDQEKKALWLNAGKQKGYAISNLGDSSSIMFPLAVGNTIGRVALSGKPEACYSEDGILDFAEVDKLTSYKTESAISIPIFNPGMRGLQQANSKDNRSKTENVDTDDAHAIGSSSKGHGRTRKSKTRKRESTSTKPVKVLGVIQAINKTGGKFTSEDEHMLASIAAHCSGFLYEAQLADREFFERRKNEAMLAIAVSLTESSLDTKRLLRTIMSQISFLLHADRCTLFLMDRSRKYLWSIVADGAEEWNHFTGGESIIQIPVGKGIAGTVAVTGEMMNVPNAYQCDLFNDSVDKATGYKTQSVLCGPLRNGNNEIIGVVQLINKIVHNSCDDEAKDGRPQESRGGSVFFYEGREQIAPFDENDEKLLEGMFSMIGVALDNSELYSRTMRVQNRLRNIVTNISDVVFSFDMDGLLTSVNRPLEDVLGKLPYTDQELRQNSVLEWWPDEKTRGEIKEVLEGAEAKNGFEQSFGKSGIINYSIAKLTAPKSRRASLCSLKTEQQLLNGQETGPGSPHRMSSFNINPLSDQTKPSGTEKDPLVQVGVMVCIDDKTPERKLMSTLKQYMAPDLVEHLLEDGKLKLGGVRQKVSILFADIRGYTNYTEGVGEAEVFSTLNEYFTCMVGAISDHKGIVDKFIGDALMAVFGVPKPSPNGDDCTNACKAAIEMTKRLVEFNKVREQNGKPPIKIGIGIGTGEVLCGNIGAENRFEYTVIGDAVNIASRLEAMTKEYGVDILIGESTVAENGVAELGIRCVDTVRVAGKDESTEIYELLGTELSEERSNGIRLFAEGMEAYRTKQLDSALELFHKGSSFGDGPSELYLERTVHLKETPPPPEWDGVWEQTKVSVWTYRYNEVQQKNQSQVEAQQRRLSTEPRCFSSSGQNEPGEGKGSERSGSIENVEIPPSVEQPQQWATVTSPQKRGRRRTSLIMSPEMMG